MAGRGRKSAEAQAAALLPGTWPAPPDDLAEPEAAIWIRITTGLPSDWFTPPNFPLLKQLCRHVYNGDLLAEDIVRRREEIEQARQREADAADLKAKARERTQVQSLEKSLHRLLRAHGYESDRALRLSTKLKLTLQSRYRRSDGAAAATARPTLQPWLDWGRGRRQ